MKEFPNVLMIVGQGQKVGKTSLACRIIEKFSPNGVYALKVSLHFHELGMSEKLLFVDKNYRIIEEVNPNSEKDSAKFLLAGAQRVFFIQAFDVYVFEAFTKLLELIDIEKPFIVESAGLRKYIKPGLFFFVETREYSSKNEELKYLANKSFCLRNESFGFDFDKIELKNNKWALK
jgi:hypothetical protein